MKVNEFGYTRKELQEIRQQIYQGHAKTVASQERKKTIGRGQITQQDIDFLRNALEAPVELFVRII